MKRPGHRRDGGMGRWPAMIAAGAVVALFAAVGVAGVEWQTPKTVRLVVDYGDGVEKHFTSVTWKQGMTVLDAMEFAKKSPHGIRFEYKGRGETALLTQIDDLKNEGGGRKKKNWIYYVNDKAADKSFAARKLESSDVVRWKFTTHKFD